MTLTQTKKNQSNSKEVLALESFVGNTPLIALHRSMPGLNTNVKVFAKAEWFNPGGSVKDRPALNIIRSAISNNDLIPGKRLLDSTSGNMGIAYATFGASMGIPVTLCVPENASPERITILKVLGAEIILTDPSEGSDGAILVARKMAAQKPELYWYANQYNNVANWQAHYLTTGPEIVHQTKGKITHLVAGLGTSGTLIGTGRYLREQLLDVRIVAVQPDDSFHGLEGLKHMQTAIKPGIFDPLFADRTIEIHTEHAYDMVRVLARTEGLFVGVSSGAAAIAALQVAAELNEGVVVTIFPDAGYKYLSDQSIWEGK